jgi:hypothetical protein
MHCVAFNICLAIFVKIKHYIYEAPDFKKQRPDNDTNHLKPKHLYKIIKLNWQAFFSVTLLTYLS